MNTISRNIILAAILAVSATGCSNFLDINPKGEVFDKDMFESAEGYEDAVYGIYAELGTESYLYSDYYMWLPEALSCNVRTTSGGLMYMSQGMWTHTESNPIRNQIWAKTYTVINHINNILDHIEEGGDNEFRYTPLYKGECLALRALLHFELLKLYGAPEWASEADKAKAIPYVTEYSFDITPFSSNGQVYEKIIADLKEAEKYLAEDETLLPAARDNGRGGGFTSCRIIHMNLYAVQALLARIYWYRNDMENAALYARKVIDSKKFTFRGTAEFNQPDNGTLDLNETIFGLYSIVAQTSNAKQYGLSGSSSSSTFSLADDYRSLYESGTSSVVDFRLSAWFDDSEQRLRKMANITYYNSSETYSGKSILGVNVIRIPEMYYIMAEALLESDPDAATEYYDDAVSTRGLDRLSDSGSQVNADLIYLERRKEFYGEGLHWMNMKRLGKDIVISVTTTLPGNEVSTYKIPYPLNEDENRQ